MAWPPVVFPGTTEERDALAAAVGTGCTCQGVRDGHTSVCGAHTLLLDERALKYLIFYRRWRAVLWTADDRIVAST